MIRRQIRNLHSDRVSPPRVFDVVVEDGAVSLEVKVEKKRIETIPWEDVVFQVEAAKAAVPITQKETTATSPTAS